MHLVFPPFLPSGFLNLNSTNNFEVCECVCGFFLLLYTEIFTLVAAAEQMFLKTQRFACLFFHANFILLSVF